MIFHIEIILMNDLHMRNSFISFLFTQYGGMEEQKTCSFHEIKKIKCSSFVKHCFIPILCNLLFWSWKGILIEKPWQLTRFLLLLYLLWQSSCKVTFHVHITLFLKETAAPSYVLMQTALNVERKFQHFLGQPYLLMEICNSSSEFKFKPMFLFSYQIRYTLEKSSSAVLLLITSFNWQAKVTLLTPVRLQLELLE